MNRSVAVFTILSGLMSFSLAVYSQTGQNKQPTKSAAKHDAPAKQDVQQSEGDRIFQQHCARCHNAPEGFSSRISGTISRHMRVRASLSQPEEEELLRFLNP